MTTADDEEGSVVMEGKIILEGRYRIVQRLSQRPRLNLYLGRRLPLRSPDAIDSTEPVYEPLVAIRELLLTDLAPEIRAQIEAAAFEEFVSPTVFGSSRLPTTGDRVWIEGERHYLIMQLSGRQEHQYEQTTTLDALLLDQHMWPRWLDDKVTLTWGIQLCRIVARLNRQGVILGDLTPTTVLIDADGRALWSPILLPSWPPAPHYWKTTEDSTSAAHLYDSVFPIAESSADNVFVAPEILRGTYDERSDVYSLGAILYLLLTHYAPIAAMRRVYAEEGMVFARSRSSLFHARQESAISSYSDVDVEGLELIAPRLLNARLSSSLEQVVVRALELEPARRYASVFALVEALELVDVF